MCYQVFVRYACGHDDTFDAVCEIGEGNPFWVKIGCPVYQLESKYPTRSCGVGQYYCGRNGKDGAYLDEAHVVFERCKADLLQLDANLVAIRRTAQDFMAVANAQNIPQEVRKFHPAHDRICRTHYHLKDLHADITKERDRAADIISEGIQFYGPLPDGGVQTDLATRPAFVPVTNGRIPLELQPLQPIMMPPPGIPTAAPTTAVTEQAIDVSQNSLMHRAGSRLPPSEGENINVAHVRRDSGTLGPHSHKAAPTSPPQKTALPEVALTQSGSGFRDTAAKRIVKQNARPVNSPRRKHVATKTLPPFPTEDSNTIRRSTRVRKQKVNYAESQASDASRDNSPDKSEQYEESPEKERSISDWSEAPESPEPPARGRPQRKPQRRAVNGGNRSNNDTLASKIGDWKRRSGEVQGANNGKSASKDGTQAASGRSGGQAGGQRNGHDKQTSGSQRASSNVWRAPPSAHAQVLMQGGGNPYAAGGQGMFGSSSGMPSTQSTNPMQPTLGRPFPDNSDATAVVGSNIFNKFLQQTRPSTKQSTQSAQSWSVHGGMSYPTQQQQQMFFRDSSQSTTPSGYTYQPLDFQNYGDARGFNGALSGMSQSAGSGFTQPGSLPGLNAYTAGLNQDSSSAMQMPAPDASFGTDPYFNNQAGYYIGNNAHYGGYNQGAASGLQTPADSSAASVGQTGEYNQMFDYSQAPEVDYNQLPNVASYSDYNRMRQSFGAARDLSPTNTLQATDSDTEPKKRAYPASSPTPAKRVRLSMPGEGEMTITYGDEDDGTAAMSSPAKMPMQQEEMTKYSAPFENTVHIVSPTPAPIVSPAAIHFPQAQAAAVVENLEDAADLPSMGVAGVGEQQGGVETGDDGGDVNEGIGGDAEGVNEDSEFDLSMLDDDTFSFGDA